MSRNKIVEGPHCPFWRAAATDQRHIDPDAPAPLDANGQNKISAAVEMLMYHAGFSKTKATAVAELLVPAANHGALAKAKAVITQTFVPNHLVDGMLDKKLRTGMLRFEKEDGVEQVGIFSSEYHEKMFRDANASDYQIDGKTVRGMTEEQLKAFVEGNKESIGAGRIHHTIAKVEMVGLLLGLFGRETDDGQKVITKRATQIFFEFGIYPHARLEDRIEAHYPAVTAMASAGTRTPAR